MWDLPGPGLKPMSLALAGGFLTTAPPGKSWPGVIIAFTFPQVVEAGGHGDMHNAKPWVLAKTTK